MTTATRPPQLCQGATTCDLRPEWVALTPEGAALGEACFAAPIGEHLPWLVYADWLDERDDPRGWWVRQFVYWEGVAKLGEFGDGNVVAWGDRVKSFGEAAATVPGWRWLGLYGAVAGRWCPDGYGGGPQWETWADARVSAVNRWCVLWACGLVSPSQADASRGQAEAARWQAEAARGQADAARGQGDAAWWQADAARWQADAAWWQAEAARGQAEAAWWQAWGQGDAARVRCNDWYMRLWSLMRQHMPTTEGG